MTLTQPAAETAPGATAETAETAETAPATAASVDPTATAGATRLAATVPAPPRWAVRAAHVAAVTALPAGLWRLGLVAGWHGGYTEAGYHAMGFGGWGSVWPVFLSLFTEALALLTLGLVRPWGTAPPRWVPFVGGRPVNPRAVVLAASLGAAGLAVLWTPFAGWWALPGTDMTPLGHVLVGFLYLPTVAWAPLLAAVTLSYHRRHRAAAPTLPRPA